LVGSEAKPPDPGRPLAGLRVLIVEDAPPFRAALAAMARRLGAAVETAGTAEEGAAPLRARGLDLAIVDIGLPDRPGGALLAEAVGDGATAALLAVSADAAAADAPTADLFAVKPFEGVESFGRATAAALAVGRLRLALGDAGAAPAGGAILRRAARRFAGAAGRSPAAFAAAATALEVDAAAAGLRPLAARAGALAARAVDAAPAAARLALLCALAAEA
jgi:CheY-like chemotaxis protein